MKFPLPKNIKESERQHYWKLSNMNWREPTVKIEKGISINHEAHLFKWNKILPDSFVNPEVQRKRFTLIRKAKFLLKNYLLRKKVIYKRKVIWFIDNWSHSYFHWVTEALPRLLLVEEEAKSVPILLPKYILQIQFVRETLEWFDIFKLITLEEREVYKIKELILPLRTADSPSFNPRLLEQVRVKYLGNKSGQNGDVKKRIYISRSLSDRRQVINEDDVVKVLLNYNFEVINMEQYAFKDQVDLMRQTKYLVSLHGAGLTNLIFMPSDGKILELRHGLDTFWDCYYRLSSAFGLAYYYQICDIEDQESDLQLPDEINDSGVVVNLEILEKNIQLLLENSA